MASIIKDIRDYTYFEIQQYVQKLNKKDLPYLLKDVQKEIHEKYGEKHRAESPNIVNWQYVERNPYEQELFEEHVYQPLLEDIKKLEVLEKEIRLKLKITTSGKESPQIPQEILEALEKEKLIKVIKTSPLELKWIGSNSLCAYFVDKHFVNQPNLWAVGEKLFDVNSLAQVKNNYISYNKTGKPRGYDIIDRILEDYKSQKAQQIEKCN